jgi:hypothetical protein
LQLHDLSGGKETKIDFLRHRSRNYSVAYPNDDDHLCTLAQEQKRFGGSAATLLAVGKHAVRCGDQVQDGEQAEVMV